MPPPPTGRCRWYVPSSVCPSPITPPLRSVAVPSFSGSFVRYSRLVPIFRRAERVVNRAAPLAGGNRMAAASPIADVPRGGPGRALHEAPREEGAARDAGDAEQE